MNPNSCSTTPAPTEAEWLFADGDLSLVAHVPTEGNFWSLIRLDEPGAVEDLTPKARAITRALLVHALDLLDRSEPSRATTGGVR